MVPSVSLRPKFITAMQKAVAKHLNQAAVDERADPRGNPYFWIGFRRILSNPPQGTDLRAIYDGFVSVTPLRLDRTDLAFSEKLKGVLK